MNVAPAPRRRDAGPTGATRRLARAPVLALGLAAALAPAQGQDRAPGAPVQPRPVQAPHYGDALYATHAGRPLAALAGLMASQQLGRVAPHDDEGELLRGGLLLGYGLHREAASIFERVLAGHAAPAVQDRAWFLLARSRWQRGLVAESEAALDRVQRALPAPLEEERQLLKGQLMMARGDAAGAAAWLQRARGLPGLATSGYLRFNLGVALVRAGEVASGRAVLDELARAAATDEEARRLRDRVHLALGFAALRDGAPREARAHLQRVRLHAMDSGAALLGAGWAAAALDEPREALVPWTELLDRGGADAAVLEARLAVPQALADLQAHGAALRGYETALSAYARERDALDASIDAVRGGAWVRALLARTDAGMATDGAAVATGALAAGSDGPGPTVGTAQVAAADVDLATWITRGAIAPGPDLPHPTHLLPLLAGHEVQQALRSLLDLRMLQRNLRQWEATLDTWRDVLAHRLRVHEDRLPQLRAALSGPGADGADAPAALPSLARLQAQLADLAAQLEAAARAADGRAFATAHERSLQARLDRSRAALRAWADAPADDRSPLDGQALAARLDRAQGALDWHLAREQASRLWTARRALAAGTDGLRRADAQAQAIARAQVDEPRRLQALGDRLEALAVSLRALQPPLQAAGADQQDVLQALAVAVLVAQRQRLDGYADQARYALAQLHDRALTARADAPAAGVDGEARR